MAERTYDFIVVGGGTAGCHIARRLADAKSSPSVALIEGGADLRETCSHAPCDRYNNPGVPDSSYGYMTAPQTHLNGQNIPYLRGKGLGGSSALNFMVYSKGSTADFDLWADETGDEAWGWEQVKERYKRIERMHVDVAEDVKKYANPAAENYGTAGPVDVCLPPVLEKGAHEVFKAASEMGLELNLDHNSGNSIGVSISPSSSDKCTRVTSATANLTNPPASLSVIHEVAHKILFDGKKAVGVQFANGKQLHASKEVILTLGSIDTPKLLMLSGVGSVHELAPFNIPVISDLPGVGKNFQDHFLSLITCEVRPEFTDNPFFDDPSTNTTGREQWAKDKTGPAISHSSNLIMAYLKDPNFYTHPSFQKLDKRTQDYVSHPAVPNMELILFNGPAFPPGSVPTPPNVFLTMVPIGQTTQSRGTISLASADPTIPAIIDTNYLGDPTGWDRMIMVATVRKAFEYVRTPTMSKYFVKWFNAPVDDTDEEINKFINAMGGPVWHASCSTRMGKEGDADAVVDSKGRVFGVKGLRVADLSVCPQITSNHTQPTAYLVAQTIGEMMIEEYGL